MWTSWPLFALCLLGSLGTHPLSSPVLQIITVLLVPPVCYTPSSSLSLLLNVLPPFSLATSVFHHYLQCRLNFSLAFFQAFFFLNVFHIQRQCHHAPCRTCMEPQCWFSPNNSRGLRGGNRCNGGNHYFCAYAEAARFLKAGCRGTNHLGPYPSSTRGDICLFHAKVACLGLDL